MKTYEDHSNSIQPSHGSNIQVILIGILIELTNKASSKALSGHQMKGSRSSIRSLVYCQFD